MRSIPSDHGRFHTRKAGPKKMCLKAQYHLFRIAYSPISGCAGHADDSAKGKCAVLTSVLLTGEISDTDHTCRRAQLGGRDARHGAVTGTDDLLRHALTGYIEE